MASKKKKKKKSKINGTLIGIVAVFLVIVIAAVLVVYFFFPDVFDGIKNKVEDIYSDYVKIYYNDSTDDDPEGTVAVSSAPVAEGTLAGVAEAKFSIHFLELGNKYAGDCTLIKCGDTEVLIDAGSRTNSATAIKDYVDQYCTDGKLEYVVATHAHQDHIAGFVGANSGKTKTGLLYQYDIGTIIEFSGHNTTANIYKNFCTAVNYAKDKGAKVYDAKQCWNEEGDAKRSYDLSGDGKLTLNVLYNYYYENTTADENDYSVCLLLSYKPAEGNAKHYLFTGDLEGAGESKLVDYYTSNTVGDTLPEVELFKGAHHGSKTSSTDKLLQIVKPKKVAVCCCAGATEYTTNNDNTFPTQAFVDRISSYTDAVYCTSLCIDYKNNKFESMNGNIVFYLKDREELELWCSNSTVKLKEWDWFKNNRKCPNSWK